jgi:hypothetical protein
MAATMIEVRKAFVTGRRRPWSEGCASDGWVICAGGASEKRATTRSRLSFSYAFLEEPQKTDLRAALQRDPKMVRACRNFGS